tara:strand:- start:97 stop:453 length:357 start_codon:yes stop_codon:yes gene_type:complete
MEKILKAYGAQKTNLTSTVQKIDVIVQKFKKSGIDQLNISNLTAQLMVEVQKMKLNGFEKKELVLSLLEEIIGQVSSVKDVVEEEISRLQIMVPAMIDNFSILLKQKKKMIKNCCLPC